MRMRAFSILILLDLVSTTLFMAGFLPSTEQTIKIDGFKTSTLTSDLPESELTRINTLIRGLGADLTYPQQYDSLTSNTVALRITNEKKIVDNEGYALYLHLGGIHAEYDPDGEVIVPLLFANSIVVDWKIIHLEGNAESATVRMTLVDTQKRKIIMLLRAIPIRFTVRRFFTLQVGLYRILSGILVLLSSTALVLALVKNKRML